MSKRSAVSSFIIVLILAPFFCAAGSMFAMSVRPPEFAELVEKADAIVRGEVVAVRSEWRGTEATRRIVTLVTFRVVRSFLSQIPATVELEFLGGKVGPEELQVPGQPVFQVGADEILFVRGNGRELCPLVHAMFGRFRVLPGKFGAPAVVARNDGVPLASLDEVSMPLITGPNVALVRAVKRGNFTAADFETEIVKQARAIGRPVLP